MEAGRRKNLVTIKELVAGQDTLGQPGLVLANIATVPQEWADIMNMNGKEASQANKEQVNVNAVSIRMRYRTDITTKMVVVHDGVTYEIKAVLPDRRRKKHVDLACEVING